MTYQRNETPEPMAATKPTVQDELALVRSVLHGYPMSFARNDALRALSAVEAALADAQRDAERYRFVRMNRLWMKASVPATLPAPMFDEKIDAARAKFP